VLLAGEAASSALKREKQWKEKKKSRREGADGDLNNYYLWLC
jgi:hypothetical protein